MIPTVTWKIKCHSGLDPESRQLHNSVPIWIPAFAGMTQKRIPTCFTNKVHSRTFEMSLNDVNSYKFVNHPLTNPRFLTVPL